jgi:hypothetical protein
VRGELEAAMARVLTSPAAGAHYQRNPAEFAETYLLTDDERGALLGMVHELSSLTASFVKKRERTLRAAAFRTLGLLGPLGNRLLARYIDLFPPLSPVADDQSRFAGYLVDSIRSLVPELDHGDAIDDMARAERWNGEALRAVERSSGPPAPPFSSQLLVCVAPGAYVDAFRHDVRTLRRFDAEGLRALEHDPCHLLFHRTQQVPTVRVFKLAERTADALASMATGGARPVDVTEDERGLADLARLYRHGVLEAAR